MSSWWIKSVFCGILSWLVPFAVSLPFYGKDGVPVIPVGALKSLMVLAGGASGAYLLLRVLRQRPPLKQAGLVIGLLWLAINVSLDLLVLVPLANMSLRAYFGEIGLRYALIPIMSVTIDSAVRFSGHSTDKLVTAGRGCGRG
jgi:hypothetical protein